MALDIGDRQKYSWYGTHVNFYMTNASSVKIDILYHDKQKAPKFYHPLDSLGRGRSASFCLNLWNTKALNPRVNLLLSTIQDRAEGDEYKQYLEIRGPCAGKHT